MKKLLLFLLPAITISFFTSCKKNYAEEHYTEIVNPVIPDFTTQVNAGVNGFITDENNNAVEGATVKAGTITVITDQFGYFTIDAAAFAKTAGFVQVSKSGYYNGYRTFLPVAGKESFIRLQLIPKINTGTISAIAGGSVTTADGAIISLPSDAVVNASTNADYSGTINVAAHWLDPSAEAKTQLTMPGNLTGIDSAGHLNVLVTYGMLAVELTGSGGEALQIASGKKATLEFPLPASFQSTAPPIIPLWYFDESRGVWKEEGTAVKNGNKYSGAVSHFTYWNADIGLSALPFTMQLVDAALRPLSNTEVAVKSRAFNSYSHGYTDTLGYIYGFVPANSALQIEADVSCGQNMVIKNIQTASSDIDLGAIILSSQEFSAFFEGTASKCSGAPVTDGFVALKENGIYHSIKIQNGVFHSAIAICPNASVTITAFDREAIQQSSPRNIVAVNGINDLGVLSACLPISGEFIIYEFDGVSRTLTLSEDLFEASYVLAYNYTYIKAINLITGGVDIAFGMEGPPTAGSHVIGSDPILDLYNHLGLSFQAPLSWVISEYGLIGQFIKGSYNGTVIGSSTHSFNCTFQLKRDQ